MPARPAKAEPRPASSRSVSGYRLERYEPVKRGLTTVFVALLSIGAFLGSYKFGEYNGMQRGLAITGVKPLKERIKALEAEKSELASQTERLRRTAELDQKAVAEVKLGIERTEAKLQELNEELSFYKTIVSPSKLQAGLHIQDFRIEPGEQTGEYFYTLVLTQAQLNRRLATGDVVLHVLGSRAGEAVSLPFEDLVAGGDGKIDFGFKYFQSMTGRFVLPANFSPTSVKLQLRPTTKGLKALRRTYRWTDVQAGEG